MFLTCARSAARVYFAQEAEAAEAERRKQEEIDRLEEIAAQEYDRQQKKLKEQQRRERKERNRTFPRKLVKDYEKMARQFAETSQFHVVEHLKRLRSQDDVEHSVMRKPRQSGNLICSICQKNIVKYVFLPCHHACLCQKCMDMLKISAKATNAAAAAAAVAQHQEGLVRRRKYTMSLCLLCSPSRKLLSSPFEGLPRPER